MAIITPIDKTHWVTLQVEGDLSRCDLIAAVDQLYPQLAAKNIIWDLSTASLDALTQDDRVFLAHYGKSRGQARAGTRTALVSSNQTVFVQACIYTAVATLEEVPVDYFVFHTLAEAEEWMLRS